MPKANKVVKIKQGYLEVPEAEQSLRIRISDNREAEVTKKTGSGLTREEISHSISVELGFELLGACQHKISKTRNVIGNWEVDVYDQPLNGLIIAEIELESEKTPVILPKWIKECIDVTDSLTNLHLARLATDLKDSATPLPLMYSRFFPNVKKIVVTGPPLCGKTKILEKVRRNFPQIQCVPEVATIIISQVGILPGNTNLSKKYFQQAVYRVQKIFETTSIQSAISEGKKAVIFDRGTVDAVAYLEKGWVDFEKILKTKKNSEYGQYDGVIFLGPAPENVYEKEKTNNPARLESYAQAAMLTPLLYNAWKNHTGFQYIPTTKSWEEKEKMVLEKIVQSINEKGGLYCLDKDLAAQ